MDRDVPEINVEQLRLLWSRIRISASTSRREICQGARADLLEPESSHEMQRRLADHRDRSNGNRSASSRFCAITTGETRVSAVICR